MADDTIEQARTAAVDAIVNPQCTYEDRIRAIDALIAAVRAETERKDRENPLIVRYEREIDRLNACIDAMAEDANRG